MSTAAETTVTALRELLPQHTPVLAEDVLRAVRAVLIKKPQNGVAAATATDTDTDTDTATDTDTGAGKDVNILTALLHTAQTPTLTQPHRALACDALSTYLIRTRTPPHLPLPPTTTTTWADAAAAIVLAHFDDAQSPLSKALKDLLGNVLGAHPDPHAFARGLLAARVLPRLLGGGRAAGKAVYFVLEALVRRRLVGAGFVFGAFPGGGEACVVGALLGAVGDRTVAPVVGKALAALLGARRAEIEGEEEWVRGWRGAVECALGEEALRGNVVTYVLPGLFRLSPAGFRVFVEGLGFGRYCGGEEESVVVMEAAGDDGEKKGLMSLLCCLKVGKDLGYVAEETDADAAAAREGGTNNTSPTKLTVPTAFAAPLLAHPHPHLRLAAFTLLTHTPSPTTPLPSAALSAIRAALPHLHTETDAEVRNLTTQAIRALLERLAASSHHLTKLPPHTAQPKIQETATFMQWYLHTLTAQLAPPASYQRTTTALKLLTTLHLSGLGHHHHHPPRSTPPDPKKHLNWPAAVLAATAPLFTPALRRALADALFNPFDDVRAMAGALLLHAPPDHAALETLFAAAVARMNGTGRERDADGAARVVVLLFVAQGGGVVVERVLAMLEGCVDAARRDFGAAARGRPVHGLLAGLRMVFERRGVWEGGAVGRGVVERVVAVCVAVWGVVGGVLCVDSPEGSGAAGVGEEEEEGGEVDSQTVMSYSWRAVKEASALLATLLSHAPYDPTSPATSLLQHSDFPPAGDLLLSQLSHMRHRGAFSAVSPSFTTLCTTCITSRDAALHPLPASWLAANLHLITTSSSKITRRSAGLPFLLLAVLASERDPARPLLQSTFSHLAAIAALPPPPDTAHGNGNGNGTDKIDLPQVHALNCIKHLFTDARLSAAVAPHVGEALALAVACFAAPVWALRNCGIMLFTALLTRLVGVRGRSDSNGGGGGALDARGFFERYPSARQVLLGGLAGSLDALDAGGALVEMVYPALSLVARLEYSPGFDGEVAGFVGCVRAAMGCRVWKVREMAARAYVSLVGGPEWRGVVEGLLREAGSREVGTNGAHGRLCAVRVLLERKARRGEEDLTAVWAAMDAVFGALVVRNRCAVIKAVCLQIITDHGLVTGALAEADALHEKVLSYASTAEIALAEINNAGVVGRTLFKTHLTAFMVARALHHPPTPTGITELLTLLSSRDEEAALSTAEHLLSSPHQLALTPREAALLDTTLWTLITEHPWHQLRTAALTLLTRYGTSSTTALEPHWRATLDLATTPPTEPCQHAALAALGLLTAHIWAHYQHIPDGAQWAEWALAQLLALVAASLHEDQPYPAREAALLALKALAPVLRFDALAQWRSRPVALRGAYFALYALLNDDDEDLRDGAAEAVCRLLPGRAVAYMPLRAGEALLEAMVAAFGGEEEFFGDVVERAGGGVEVRGELERLLGAAGTILFAREKQNLFVDGGVEARRWGGVLAAVEVQGGGRDFVLWVVGGLDAFEGKVRERGREGPLGWLADEEVFVLGVRVVEGVRVVRRWWERGEVDDVLWGMVVKGAEGLVAALEEVRGHEALKEGLREILHG